MDATGIASEKTVDRCLSELRRLGVLDWVRGKRKLGTAGKPNHYTINNPSLWRLEERDDWQGRGQKARAEYLARQRRSKLRRAVKAGVEIKPGEERPEDEDERKW